MEREGKELNEIARLASGIEEPRDYFAGKDWGELLLPREILCFTRSKQSQEKGWSSLSTKAKRYDQHRRFVLLTALQGRGQVGVETGLWNLDEGESILMFPHQSHYYAEIAEEFSWLFVTFELPVSFWPCLQVLRDSPRHLSSNLEGKLRSFLVQWMRSEGGASALAAANSLGAFLSELTESERVTAVGKESDLVRKVREKVQADLKENLSVKALSESLGVSGSYLRERFREGAGVSLGHFVRSVRLMEATRLLRDSSLSVREVAERSGFGSFTAFSRAFGQVYGTSPSVYRKSVARIERDVTLGE